MTDREYRIIAQAVAYFIDANDREELTPEDHQLLDDLKSLFPGPLVLKSYLEHL